MGCIYKITNQLDGLQYVGQTIDPDKRWKEHKLAALAPKRYSGKSLHFAMRKHGIEYFTFEVIEECSDEHMDVRERHWIRELNTNRIAGGRGYNLTEGGRGAGCWREAASRAQRGERSAWWGRHHTEETKHKQSQAHLGRVFTEEHRRNISIAKAGKPGRVQTDDERERRKRTLSHYMRPVVQCDLMGVELRQFASLTEAIAWLREQNLPANASHVRGCIKGTRKTAAGFTWQDGR